MKQALKQADYDLRDLDIQRSEALGRKNSVQTNIEGHGMKLRGELHADRFKDKEPDLVEIEQEHELIGPTVDLGDAEMAIEILNEQ